MVGHCGGLLIQGEAGRTQNLQVLEHTMRSELALPQKKRCRQQELSSARRHVASIQVHDTQVWGKVCMLVLISMRLTRALCWRARTQRVRGVSDGVQGHALLFDGLKQLHHPFVI